MMTMLFDENYVSEAYENEIRQIAMNEGREEGREEGIGIGREEGIGIGREKGIGIGREEGIIDTYTTLVRKNLIAKDVAANEMGISVAELEKKLQESCR